jgi:cell division septation protein DedD
MADNSLRYRMNPGFPRSRASIDETPGTEQEPGVHWGNDRDTDPLAELARLVGQVDPVTQRPNARHEPSFNNLGAAPERSSRPLSDEDYQFDRDYPRGQTQAPPLADHRYGSPDDADQYAPQSYEAEDQGADQEAYEQADQEAYEQADHREPQSGTDAGHYRDDEQGAADEQYADEQHAGDQYAEDETYAPYENTAEEAQRSRRGGLITVVMVLCLAIVGTASAYAYRTFFGGGAPGIPPLIKADTAPNKIAANASDAVTSKQIADRMGDRGQNERVVPREEQPLDIKPSRPQTQPTVGGWPLPPGSPPVSVAPSGQSLPPSSSDPRPVKTVAISPTAGQAPPSAPVAKPPSDTGSVATRVPSPRTVAPRVEPNSPTPPASQSEAALPAPARTPSAAPAAHRFVVQLSASNTREEAAAALRSAQAKYASLLGGRQTQIKEKKSAERATVYAAQIGPLASKEEATELCHRLKLAGGDCFVQ